jgi:CheY-like chemotaxis protein
MSARATTNIYIVDDDPVQVFLTTRLFALQNNPVRIQSFPDGRKAIDQIEKDLNNPPLLPDIILLDIEMPELNGWGFLDAFIPLKEFYKKTFVIYIVTSSILESDRQIASSYSIVKTLITKPLTKNLIDRIISQEI